MRLVAARVHLDQRRVDRHVRLVHEPDVVLGRDLVQDDVDAGGSSRRVQQQPDRRLKQLRPSRLHARRRQARLRYVDGADEHDHDPAGLQRWPVALCGRDAGVGWDEVIRRRGRAGHELPDRRPGLHRILADRRRYDVGLELLEPDRDVRRDGGIRPSAHACRDRRPLRCRQRSGASQPGAGRLVRSIRGRPHGRRRRGRVDRFRRDDRLVRVGFRRRADRCR